jgi:hypothetical protein
MDHIIDAFDNLKKIIDVSIRSQLNETDYNLLENILEETLERILTKINNKNKIMYKSLFDSLREEYLDADESGTVIIV